MAVRASMIVAVTAILTAPFFSYDVEAATRASLRAGSISNEDYPEEARALGQEGSVSVTIKIGVDGRVKNCGIGKSSGSSSLDATSCRLFTERMIYEPARDDAGKVVEEQRAQTITWRLPITDKAPELSDIRPRDVQIELILAADGSVEACKVVKFVSPFGEGADVACPWATKGGKFPASATSKRRRLIYRNSIEVTEIN